MTERSQRPGPRRAGGSFVLIVLAIVFFALLGLMVLYWPSKATSQAAVEEQTLYVIPIELKLRTQATTKGAVVARARRGETVTILEVNGPWARVQNREGLEGWAERNALESREDRERRIEKTEEIRALPTIDGVLARSAELFTGPGIFYPEMGSIARGEKVKIHARDHEFYAVEVSGEIAYLEAEAVDLSETSNAKFEVAASDVELDPEPMHELSPEELGIGPAPMHDMSPEELGIGPPEERVPVTFALAPEAAELLPGGVYAAVPVGGTEPQLIHRVTPRYPTAARRAGIEGPVVIRGIVRRDGAIDSVEILQDLPFGLGEAAREAVQQWRFLPAAYQGQPIDVYYTVTVNYAMTGR